MGSRVVDVWVAFVGFFFVVVVALVVSGRRVVVAARAREVGRGVRDLRCVFFRRFVRVFYFRGVRVYRVVGVYFVGGDYEGIFVIGGLYVGLVLRV